MTTIIPPCTLKCQEKFQAFRAVFLRHSGMIKLDKYVLVYLSYIKDARLPRACGRPASQIVPRKEHQYAGS